MGRDKALLELGGVALIVRAAAMVESVVGECAIVGDAVRLEGLELRVVADDFPGAGPLGGIATALGESSAEWNLVIACDLPYLTRAWLDFLVKRAVGSKADAILPMNERGSGAALRDVSQAQRGADSGGARSRDKESDGRTEGRAHRIRGTIRVERL